MPELNNIQTYVKLNGNDYSPTLTKFSKVLQQIGIWNNDIEKCFNSFEWKIEDDGFVYASTAQLGFYKTKFSEIKVRPLLMVYTKAHGDSFQNNWICCDLLIESSDLRDNNCAAYYEDGCVFVKQLVTEMARQFNQTGIYFTDEAQDGEDFDGLREKNSSKLWKFDYALIPNKLKEPYSSIPETHKVKENENHNECWYASRWFEKE